MVLVWQPSIDYYETLNVPRGADAEEIRKSYRKFARKYHPDLNPGDKGAEERFKMVQEAYDVLSDPKKRQMYDQYGFYSENGYPGAGATGPQPGMDFGGFDFSDFFSGTGERRQQGSESFGGNPEGHVLPRLRARRTGSGSPLPKRARIWNTASTSTSGRR